MTTYYRKGSDIPKRQHCDGLYTDRRGGGRCCDLPKFCVDSETETRYSCAQHLAQVVRYLIAKDGKVTVTQ